MKRILQIPTGVGVVLLCLWGVPLFAEENCEYSDSPSGLIQCVLNRSPELKLKEAALNRDRAAENAVGQVLNPELSGRGLAGVDSGSGELSLEQTFELGGKRSARKARARKAAGIGQLELRVAREETVLETILLLHHLRQLEARRKLLAETAATYGRIFLKIRRYPFLSSEQKVSLALYQSARGETLHKIGQVEQDVAGARARLALLLGTTGVKKIPLPATKRKWPEIPPAVSENTRTRLADANQELSRARLNLADARAWPDLKIGPAVEFRQSGGSSGIFGNSSGSSETEGGLSFSFTLPLYHRNSGEREFARRDLERARIARNLVQTRIATRRAALAVQYKSALGKIQQTAPPDARHRKHYQMRRLFLGGLVSPALVIEFHRELAEYLSGYQASEKAALKSLGAIYLLDGRILEEEYYARLL